jgi:PKD repeat protein
MVTILPRANPGGTFYGGTYITSSGLFDNGTAGIGKHKVGYFITDGNGCKSKDSIIVVVNGLPDARLKPAGPFCDNDGMKVVNAVSPSPLGYFCGTCQPGPGEYVTAAGNFLPDVAKAGTHPVFYKVSDANNCISKDSIKVSVNPKPVFDFNATPLKGCEPLVVNYTAAPGFAQYDWNFGNSQSGSGISPQTLYASAGDYTVSLKVTDINSCAVTISKPNYINVYPRPKADFSYSPREINLSLTQVQFNNYSKGSNITEFRWDVDDVYETDQNDFSKVFHDSGNIKISLLGC